MLNKGEVLRRLRERGATKAVVEFSGGNDEGGADRIALYDGDAEVGEVQEHHANYHFDEQQGRYVSEPLTAEQLAETDLAEALAAPVYDEYGDFAGDFSVSGVVAWDVASGRVTMSGDESAYIPFARDL